MITPLIICCLLVVPFLTARLIGGPDKAPLGGTLGIALAFAFFGFGHFAITDEMTQMLPSFVPLQVPLIYSTGVLEFTIAAGLLFSSTRSAAGVAAICVLVIFFPANVYAAINNTGMGGHVSGPTYLLIRAPLQGLLIWWTWFFAMRSGRQGSKPITTGLSVPLI